MDKKHMPPAALKTAFHHGKTDAAPAAAKQIRISHHDSVTLDSTYFTDEGYFIDEPIVTRTGIFPYKNPDGSVRRELRLPEHIFDPESLASYEGKPVIITHDAGRVDKRNVDDEIVGTILTPGYQDGEDVRAKIIIHDIDEVKRSGLRELSLGYDLMLDETPGEWNGQPYDAIQTGILINHLALVRDARAGDQARLNLDGSNQQSKGVENMAAAPKTGAVNAAQLKKTFAGKTAGQQQQKRRLDEEGAAETPEFIEKNEDSMLTGEVQSPEVAETPADRISFIRQRRDSRAQAGVPQTLQDALEECKQRDEDINELLELYDKQQAESDFNKTAPVAENAADEGEAASGGGAGGGLTMTINADSMDAVVRERLKLGRLGDRLNLDGLEEMKPLDAKKAIIRKVNPEMRLDGKSAVYINAVFDAAVAHISKDLKKDCNYQRRQMMSGRHDGADIIAPAKPKAATARDRMIERQLNGGTE